MRVGEKIHTHPAEWVSTYLYTHPAEGEDIYEAAGCKTIHSLQIGVSARLREGV